MLERVYAEGASPDIAYINVDRALEMGLINRLQWCWFKVRNWIANRGRRVERPVYTVHIDTAFKETPDDKVLL